MLEKTLKVLIIITFSMIAFFIIYSFIMEKEQEENIVEYIAETSQEDELKIIENKVVNEAKVEEYEEKKINKQQLIYSAILEIPSINLKKGLVDSDKDFDSINYAISIDLNSTYPNQNGNFILYAHSGNSKISFFDNLYKVNIEDEIYVYYNGIKYHYKVFDKYNIEKTGHANVLTSNTSKYITLITCNQQEKGKQIIIIGKLFSQSKY